MEETMTEQELIDLYYKVMLKLSGSIMPVGESNMDEARLKNLKVLCGVVELLVTDIETVMMRNKSAYEHSIKEAQKYAEDFLTKTLLIKYD